MSDCLTEVGKNSSSHVKMLRHIYSRKIKIDFRSGVLVVRVMGQSFGFFDTSAVSFSYSVTHLQKLMLKSVLFFKSRLQRFASAAPVEVKVEKSKVVSLKPSKRPSGERGKEEVSLAKVIKTEPVETVSNCGEHCKT